MAGGGGSYPFKGRQEGLFVAKIVPGKAADLAGVRVNDEILAINGIWCTRMDHSQAVNLLRNTDDDIFIRVRRQIPRFVESTVSPSANLGPLIRSRSSYHLPSSRHEERRRSRTPDPPRRRRSSSIQFEEMYPETPVEESGYLRPRTPPLRRASHQAETFDLNSYPPPVALQHTHVDSSGVHFHPYCFACNPSVVHLNPSALPSPVLQSLPPTPFIPQHIYSMPSPSNGYPSPVELRSFTSKKTSSKWSDEDEDSDSNRVTVRLQRDDVTGLGFIVSSRDGKSHTDGVL